MTSGGVLQKIMVSLYVWKNGFELTKVVFLITVKK